MQTQNLALIDANPPRSFLKVWKHAPSGALQACLSLPEGQPLAPIFKECPALAATLYSCALNAPFLNDLLRKHLKFVAEVAETPPLDIIAALLNSIETPFESQMALRRALRVARQKLMLYLALADCANTITLTSLTKALSQLADKALEAALGFELQQLAEKGDFEPDTATPQTCGLSILGLGKLGGYELNYSSDIDLMIYYCPDRFGYIGRKDTKTAAVQLTRTVCGHLSAKTSDGFVFRVDLRLRPDPGSTPIAMTLDAAETYYQSAGLTWERAALIKARRSTGDPSIAQDFLERIRPFVWRRHLDFAAIDDVIAMKDRVHKHHQHDEADSPGPGYDVKLGRGGIREIEFFAQIHQLITGGKRPDLQCSATCDVLRALAAQDDISQVDCDTLINAYEALRSSEHRLQMIADAQTHTLPKQRTLAQQHAALSGAESPLTLYDSLTVHTAAVQVLFAGLLTAPEDAPLEIPAAFENTGRSDEILKRWRSKKYRALKTQRSLALLEAVLPDILTAFAATADPDETLLAFDTFISQIPAGVQLFSLLSANRPIIDLLASVMGQSPELRSQITHRPSLFDGLLSGDLNEDLPSQAKLGAELERLILRAPGYEGVLDTVRIWNNDLRFKTGVQLLKGLITPPQAARAYSDIAEVCISQMYASIIQMFQQTHGEMPGGSFIIVALGSFGARELVTSSDLDLTFIYEVRDKGVHSSGPKPLPARDYYTRLSQRFISAITSMTSEGRLYEIDMRLRPSGRSGIIAVSLDAFEDYHQDKAWLWERMSLTKARPVAGHQALQDKFRIKRSALLANNLTVSNVRTAVWDMRQRLSAAAAKPAELWALKEGNGGLTDADFLAEGLVLENGASLGDLSTLSNWQAWWQRLHSTGCVPSAMAEEISSARQTLSSARTAKRLLFANKTEMASAPDAAKETAAVLMGVSDFLAAENTIRDARETIFTGLKTLLAWEDATHVPKQRDTTQTDAQ